MVCVLPCVALIYLLLASSRVSKVASSFSLFVVGLMSSSGFEYWKSACCLPPPRPPIYSFEFSMVFGSFVSILGKGVPIFGSGVFAPKRWT